jgi:hypothetical protein
MVATLALKNAKIFNMSNFVESYRMQTFMAKGKAADLQARLCFASYLFIWTMVSSPFIQLNNVLSLCSIDNLSRKLVYCHYLEILSSFSN